VSQGGDDLSCRSHSRDTDEVDLPLNPATHIGPNLFDQNGSKVNQVQFTSEHLSSQLDLSANTWIPSATITCGANLCVH
jgi:hypothetical protein